MTKTSPSDFKHEGRENSVSFSRPSSPSMDAPPTDALRWYEGQPRRYHLWESAAGAAPPPPPPHGMSLLGPSYAFESPAASSQLLNLPHGRSPNPSSASAGSLLYDVGPEVYAPGAYGRRSDYAGHALHPAYQDLGPGSSYNAIASGGGELQGFHVREAIRLYGMNPAVYREDTQGRYPKAHAPQKPVPRLNGGAFTPRRMNRKIEKAVKPAFCEVCKVACNSQDVLACHEAGKRHKKNLEKMKEQPASIPANSPVGKDDEAAGGGLVEPAKRRLSSLPAGRDLEAKKRRLMEEGTAEDSVKMCALCNVVCNSEIVYGQHLAGQKHAAMAKKLAAT